MGVKTMTQSTITDTSVKMIDVTTENVDKTGFFCYMSKKKSPGYQAKLTWLKERFKEGMRIKMLELPERGFIEYIPGEYAWRAVHAEGYMVIHCLWVVGKSKKKGFGKLLLEACIEDARESGFKGIAMVTSEKVWVANKKILVKTGFESVDEAPPSFNLMVKKFQNVPSPSFTGNWEQKAAQTGKGLTVFATQQCPYIPDALEVTRHFAQSRGIPFHVVEIKSAEDVRRLTPAAYGTFSIVHDGSLLSYYYLLPRDLEKLL